MSKGFESTLSASYTREHDAVTAGGQMTVGVHSEALPAGGLGDRWRRSIGVDELGETKDCVERYAKIMVHAG